MGNPEEAISLRFVVSYHYYKYAELYVLAVYSETISLLCYLFDSTGSVLEAFLVFLGGAEVPAPPVPAFFSLSEAIGSFQACVGLSETPNTEVIVTIITEDSTTIPTG